MTDNYTQIEALIYYILQGTSCENKMSLSFIGRLVGVSKSTVKRAIKKLRNDGEPILSTSEGYWRGTLDETQEWIFYQRRKLFDQISVIDSMIPDEL